MNKELTDKAIDMIDVIVIAEIGIGKEGKERRKDARDFMAKALLSEALVKAQGLYTEEEVKSLQEFSYNKGRLDAFNNKPSKTE